MRGTAMTNIVDATKGSKKWTQNTRRNRSAAQTTTSSGSRGKQNVTKRGLGRTFSQVQNANFYPSSLVGLIKKYQTKTKRTTYSLAKTIGHERTSVYNWFSKGRIPLKHMVVIANELGIPKTEIRRAFQKDMNVFVNNHFAVKQ